MDPKVISDYVDKIFDTKFVPTLCDYIRIPNCSPNYDADWDKNGYQITAAKFIKDWAENQAIKGCKVNVFKDQGYTPFFYIDIAATDSTADPNKPVVMYGHLDKQPPFVGWSEGMGPQIPVIKDKHLYGRGGADDGYAVFAALTSVKVCQDNGVNLPRIVILIEGAEESNTRDLKYYVNILKTAIGNPSLVICLDSGCAEYSRLWVSTSLRGLISIDVKVSALKIGVHSGVYGGLVPDTFMLMRQVLDKIQNPDTGEVLQDFLTVPLPDDRKQEISDMAKIVKDRYISDIPFYKDTQPLTPDIEQLIINNTWKPTLTITGADGLPESGIAGNVIRPSTTLRFSFRVPPGIKSEDKAITMKTVIEKDPPYNCKVEATIVDTADGWNLNKKNNFSTKISQSLTKASTSFFKGNDFGFFGEGGSIDFVETFNELFPTADFAVLGVDGPSCNIHGPDENIDLDYCKGIIKSLASIIADY